MTDELEPRQRMREVARGALYVVSLGLVIRGISSLIGNPTTAALLGAVLVTFVVGRTGVVTESANKLAYLRALRAAGCSFGVVALVIAGALTMGAKLTVAEPGATLWFSLAQSAAIAYRDEIWLHGIPLAFAWRARVSPWLAVGYGAALSAGVVALEPGAALPGIALSAASGAFFALLWQRTGDSWAPVAAHFAWAWTTEGLLAGEPFDLSASAGRLARGLGASGACAWLAITGFAVLTILVARGILPIGIQPSIRTHSVKSD